MKNILATSLLFLILIGCAETPKNTITETSDNDSTKVENRLIGTWKVISMQNLITSEFEEIPKDYYHLFSEDYHMILATPENRPKVFNDWNAMTDKEVRSQLPIEGGVLKYEIRGKAMYSYYISAVSASNEGKRLIDEFEFVGDTLVHRNDQYIDGQRLEWKLVRIGN